MGKRVFEVAKELGVDHRALLNTCDKLQIKVKNYMSELKSADVDRLRGALKPGQDALEETQAPGVRRRRGNTRPEPEAARQPAPPPAAAPPAAPPVPPSAAPVATQAAPPPSAAPAAAPAAAQPAPSVPVTPAPAAAGSAPAATPEAVHADQPPTKAPSPAAVAPSGEAKALAEQKPGMTDARPGSPRPTADTARVISRPDVSRPDRRRVEPTQARVLSRPDAPVAPKAPAKKPVAPVVPQGPVGDAITRKMKNLRPAHETLLRKPEAEPETPPAPPEPPAGAAEVAVVPVSKPVAPTADAPTADAPKPVAPKPVAPKPVAEASLAAERSPPPAAAGAPRLPSSDRPVGSAQGTPAPREGAPRLPGGGEEDRPREQKLAPSVTRRAPKRIPDKADSEVRAPQARPKSAAAPAAGAAKILGTIPLEQLQRRTRPPARRGPGGPGPARGPGGPGGHGGPGGPSGPPRGPARGPAPAGGGPASRFAGPPEPPMLPGGKTGEQRRRKARPGATTEPDRRPRAGGGGGGGGGAAGASGAGKRRRVFNRDDIYKGAAGAAASRLGRGRRRKLSSRKGARTQLTTPAAHKRVVRVDGTISVAELGKQLGVKANELIRKLMAMGVMATVNQQVDLDTASLIATEFDYEVKDVSFKEGDILSGPAVETATVEDPEAVLRAPVVTIMGHVDHGKTTLLDRIRSANVAQGEAGGITQHVGAYRVETRLGPVVFLDTPGHAAFTAMRARGASVTDLIVLVVAADDGVMPQTAESINHAKAANVPLIVAINKIDKPGVDPERIKQELTKFELVPEEWGGETMMLSLSALRGDGVEELLEALALQAEVLELKANPKKDAFGRVVEARVEKGRGTVATVLVQEGTLTVGDYMVAGEHYGRVRAMMDHRGNRLTEAGPSTPVEVLGLGGLPTAGDAFFTAKKEKDAKRVAEHRESETRRAASTRKQANAADLLASMGQKEREKQNLILKADVSGSLEALRSSLEQLANDEVEVSLVHSGVGGINESDIDLASASDSVVIGFNTTADSKAKRAADQAGVKILSFSVIYDVLDTVKEMLSGLLTPETVEETLGKADVRAVFHIQKIGAVAGCMVTEGKILRGAIGRVTRAGSLLVEGKVTTLKRFKDDVREVSTGYECGVAIDGYKDIQEGDTIEVVELKQIKRTIA